MKKIFKLSLAILLAMNFLTTSSVFAAQTNHKVFVDDVEFDSVGKTVIVNDVDYDSPVTNCMEVQLEAFTLTGGLQEVVVGIAFCDVELDGLAAGSEFIINADKSATQSQTPGEVTTSVKFYDTKKQGFNKYIHSFDAMTTVGGVVKINKVDDVEDTISIGYTLRFKKLAAEDDLPNLVNGNPKTTVDLLKVSGNFKTSKSALNAE